MKHTTAFQSLCFPSGSFTIAQRRESSLYHPRYTTPPLLPSALCRTVNGNTEMWRNGSRHVIVKQLQSGRKCFPYTLVCLRATTITNDVFGWSLKGSGQAKASESYQKWRGRHFYGHGRKETPRWQASGRQVTQIRLKTQIFWPDIVSQCFFLNKGNWG